MQITGSQHIGKLVLATLIVAILVIPSVMTGSGPGEPSLAGTSGPSAPQTPVPSANPAPSPGASPSVHPAPVHSDPVHTASVPAPALATSASEAPRASSRIPMGESDETGGSWLDGFPDSDGINTWSNITVEDGSVSLSGIYVQMQNPSFEQPVGSEWAYAESDSDFEGSRSTSWSSHGSRSYRLQSHSGPLQVGDNCSISQDVDLTYITEIIFDARFYTNGDSIWFRYGMLIDGVEMWARNQTDSEKQTYSNRKIDVTLLSGTHTITFKLTSIASYGGGSASTRYFYVDNIRTNGIPVAFSDEGWATSTLVSIVTGSHWDTFSLGKEEAEHTQISVSILDGLSGTPISGYLNKGSTEFDISDIDAEAHSSLRFRAWLQGNSSNSPFLNWWGVSFNASDAWRDSFLGKSKFSTEANDVDVLEGQAGLELIQGPNFAAGATTIASSVEAPQYSADNAVDEDMVTRWASEYADDEWLTVDLGSEKAVSLVVIFWEEAFGKSYWIEGSDDNTSWTQLAAVVDGNGGKDEMKFARDNFRYIRMFGSERGTGWGYSIFEFEVYDQYYAPQDAIISSLITPTLNRRYHQLHVDMEVHSGTSAWVSLLDGTTEEAIPGFENVTGTAATLESVDPVAHPSLRLRLDFASDGYLTPRINTWSVSWAEDIPVLVADIPDRSIDEDQYVRHLYDLGEHFNDTYTSDDELDYTIYRYSVPAHVDTELNEGRYLGIKVNKENWFGHMYLSVNASDGEFVVASNTFTVRVLAVNDPPVWKDIEPVNFTEDDGAQVVADLFGNISDPDSDNMDIGFLVVNNTDPEHFTFTVNNESGYLWVDYPGDFFGGAEVTVQANDTVNLVEVTLDVNVLPVNDPPSVTLRSPANGTGLTSSNITLQWDPAVDIDSTTFTYDLYFGTDSRPVSLMDPAAVKVRGLTKTRHVVGPLEAGEYYWKVVPSDGTDEGHTANGYYWFEVDTTQENPIVDLVFPPDKATMTSEPVVLRWRPEYSRPGFLLYDIYLSPNATADSLLARDVQGTSFEVTGLTSGQDYAWSVIPHNGSFLGVCRTGQRTFTYDDTQDYLIAEVNLLEPADKAKVPGDNVTLTWSLEGDEPSSGVEYNLFLGTDIDRLEEQSGDPVATSATLTGLRDQTTYFWTVIPVTGDGLVGICLDGIRQFQIEAPVFEYKLGLSIPPAFSVAQGSSGTATVTVSNRGDTDDHAELSWDAGNLEGMLVVTIGNDTLASGDTIVIPEGGSADVSLTFTIPGAGAPGTITPADYSVIVTAHSLGAQGQGQSIMVTEDLTVTVSAPGGPDATTDTDDDDKGFLGMGDSGLWILLILILIIVVAVIAVAIRARKQKKAAEPVPYDDGFPAPPTAEELYGPAAGAAGGEEEAQQLESTMFQDQYLADGTEGLEQLPPSQVLDVEVTGESTRDIADEEDDALDDLLDLGDEDLGAKLPTDYTGPPGGVVDTGLGDEYDHANEPPARKKAPPPGLDIQLPEDLDDGVGDMPDDDDLLDDVGEAPDEELLGEDIDEEALLDDVGEADEPEPAPTPAAAPAPVKKRPKGDTKVKGKVKPKGDAKAGQVKARGEKKPAPPAKGGVVRKPPPGKRRAADGERPAPPKKKAGGGKGPAAPKKRAGGEERPAAPKKRAGGEKRPAAPKKKAGGEERPAPPENAGDKGPSTDASGKTKKVIRKIKRKPKE